MPSDSAPSDQTEGIRPVIWMRPVGSRRGPKPAHTREDLTRAAISIADSRGLEEVTIRAVAGQLGAGPASLYRYIDSKDDLHDLMLDAVTAEYDLPPAPTGDWRADLTDLAERARVVHRRHPWAFTLSDQASWGPEVQAFMEYFFAALAPAGLDLREQTELLAQFNSSVATFAAHESWQAGGSDSATGGADANAAMARVLHFQQIAADTELPHLSEVVRNMLTAQAPDADELFRGIVDRLLDSVEARRR